MSLGLKVVLRAPTPIIGKRKPAINPFCKSRGSVELMGNSLKFEGITQELQNILNANMDEVAQRRRVREAFKDIQLSLDHVLFKTPCEDLKMTETYEVNSRGLEIFTKSWLPGDAPPKAIVCVCHGYGIARRIASYGFGVFAMDYPGFGLSEGLHGYIPSFDTMVNDAAEYYSKVKENWEYGKVPCFLFGQSMGGAVALKMHFKQPDSWDGAVLVAPMCKISDEVVPPWPVTQILTGIAKLLPTLKLVPHKDLAALAFKQEKKRQQCTYNVIAYKDKPRLGTALELLRTTGEIERQLQKVCLPLLILHGEEDKVTDPSVSKALYEKASSTDKKLILYEAAWHALLEGEPDDIILGVFDDIVSWLHHHC